MNAKTLLFFSLLILFVGHTEAQLVLSNTAPSVLVDFDNTLPGVNNGQFSAAGFSPLPATGQLSSRAWRVSGFSFDDAPTDAIFGRGVSAGGVTTGGIYAFTTSPGNRCLGVQPTAAFWAPGFFVLRIQNGGSTPITALTISYEIKVYNDQPRSNSFNFSHSADDVSYTPVVELNYTSPGPADATPTWQTIPRSTTLTGLNIAPGSYYYLRWSGADVSGAGARDEFGLDDVQVSALFRTLEVRGNGNLIANGSTIPAATNGTDFGQVEVASVGHTQNFWIVNGGSTTINLTGTPRVSIGGVHAADFTLTQQPASIIAPGDSTLFQITFLPSATGVRNATISIANDVAESNPYVFAISGVGTYSLQSDIIADPDFIYPVNIPYINHQAGDITPTNIGNGAIEVGRFTIRDGGGNADNDSRPTILQELTLAVDNCSYIRRIAIYDGNTEVAELAPTCPNISFTALNLVAPDGGSKTFRLVVSFQSVVTDKAQLQFRIVGAVADASGSGFASSDAGGAQTSTEGDNNRLNVLATRLVFVRQPSDTGVEDIMAPFVQIHAADANGSIDTDFVGAITLTSTGTMTPAPLVKNAVAGRVEFNNIVHMLPGSGFTLQASAVGLAAATSLPFNIFNQTVLQPGDLMVIGFDNNIGLGVDRLALITMVELLPGTSFLLTNAVYEVGDPAGVRSGRWFDGNGSAGTNIGSYRITYNGPGNVAAGSVICINLPTIGLPNASNGFFLNGNLSTAFSVSTVNGGCGVLGTSVNISTTQPDAIFLMQGNWVCRQDHYVFAGRVLSGIQSGGSWYTVNDDLSNLPSGAARRLSRIPPAIECFAIQANSAPANYFAYYNGVKSGSQPNLIAQIVNYVSNWISGSGDNSDNISAVICNSVFTVSGAGIDGLWTGAEDNNWFNCRNWETLRVPDETVDVYVLPSAARDIVVDAAAPFSDIYADTARCRNMMLAHRNLLLQANPTNVLVVHGNFTIEAGGSLIMDDGNPSTHDGTLIVMGNWNNQRGGAGFVAGNGEVRWQGNATQQLYSIAGSEHFAKVVLDNPAGLLLNASDMHIAEEMLLVYGVVYGNQDHTATDYSPYVGFAPGAAVYGTSNNSYIAGWVRKAGNEAFVFPVGDGGYYAPIAIGSPSAITDVFSALYLRQPPGLYYDPNQRSATLHHISYCEFWMLNRDVGSAAVNVTLSYDDVRSCGITPGQEGDLRVARWDGNLWFDEGGTTDLTQQTVTSAAAIASFSPFTLASTTAFNPLPLDWLYFHARAQQAYVQLDWAVNQWHGLSYFEVQRSGDALQFQTMARIEVQAGSYAYAYADGLWLPGSYYRVVAHGIDGQLRYSPVRFVGTSSTEEEGIYLYPNPLTQNDNLHISGIAADEQLRIRVMSLQGQLLAEFYGLQQDTVARLSRWLHHQARGMYLLEVITQKRRPLRLRLLSY